jgi:opacity protein-like surface antigen
MVMRRAFLILSVGFLLMPASESEAITGLGLGVRGGMIQNYKYCSLEGISTTGDDWLREMPMLGVHLKVGTLRIVDLEASVEYAWKKKEINLRQVGRAEFSINHLSLNATAKYMFSLLVFKPYVGAGAGMHRLAYGLSSGGHSIVIPEDQNRLGLHALGGLVFSAPAFPLELMAEARYTTVQTEGSSTHYSTILLGLTYKLP